MSVVPYLPDMGILPYCCDSHSHLADLFLYYLANIVVCWMDCTNATVTDCAPRRLLSVRPNLVLRDCVTQFIWYMCLYVI